MCASSSSTVWQASRVGLDQGCQNWSGSLRFRPSRIESPRTEQDLASLVRTIAAQGRTLRPIGSAHSASPIIVTADVLVSLDHLKGLYEHDERSQQVTFGAGTKLTEVGERLHSIGLAMPTFGDVATQTVARAIGSGTHGSGRHLYNLSMVLIGGRLVTADGEVREVSFEQDPDFIRALRVSFGTLGVFSSMRLQLEPIYDLHRQEWCCQIDDCLSRLDEISRENRNFGLYWYPRCDEANLRCLNLPGNEPDYVAFARLIDDQTGPSHMVIPKHSNMPHRFEEMEYALPAEAGWTASGSCGAASNRNGAAAWLGGCYSDTSRGTTHGSVKRMGANRCRSRCTRIPRCPSWIISPIWSRCSATTGGGRTGPKSTPCGQMTCGPSIPSGMTS